MSHELACVRRNLRVSECISKDAIIHVRNELLEEEAYSRAARNVISIRSNCEGATTKRKRKEDACGASKVQKDVTRLIGGTFFKRAASFVMSDGTRPIVAK
jgi:hypothetical protein